jgi:hypothetical protein
VCTIRPTSPLPVLTSGGTTIDGYTQDGASPAAASTPAVLLIEIDGINAGPVMTHGFRIESANNSISGLVINRFLGHRIFITGS